MNYREFTERVYNYKHGLTNSAESQNIQHSAKQTEETNENEQHNAEQNNEENGEEHIAHSEKGGSWDQHKYIRKEYLGNGNWRYIYEDGSSNVTNAANEKEADVKEGAYQANKAYGNGAQNTNYQTNEAKMTSSNSGFTQARKDMYKELGEKAADHNKQLENLQGVVKSLEQSNADQAEAARQAEKEALAAKAQARSDRYNKMANLDVNTSAAPYQQLTNQSVEATNKFNNKTNNPAAYNLLLDYSKGLKEVYDALKAKGYNDKEIDDFINEVESSFEYPKGMYNQIKNFDNNSYINFMDGAEAGIRDAINDVIPALKNEAEGYRGKNVDNFMKGIDDMYIRTFDSAVQAINNGELPAKEAPNPYDSYLRNLGYDPADITGADLKKAFPSMYNPNFSDEEHYALQNDQTFAPITKTEEPSNDSSIDPNKWYNSATGEFVTGTTEADDNAFFAAYRKSFYNTLVNQMKNSPKFTNIYSEKEIEDLARSWTNSNVENMKIAASKNS